MKNNFFGIINKILKARGFYLIKKYRLEHLENKYDELTNELEKNFQEFTPDYIPDKKRSELLKKLYGTGVTEALYIVYFLNKSNQLSGDVCEFGIANGATSALIANEIKKTKKNLWLFDSFKGLSKPTENDILINDIFGLGSMEKYEGSMSYGVQEVEGRLAEIKFPRKKTRIIKGYIEKSIHNKSLPKKISFAFIDFDLYQPIKIALDFLNKKLVPGGIILVDDYGYFSSGAKKAVDDFLNENKEKFKLTMPKKFAGYFCILQKTK